MKKLLAWLKRLRGKPEPLPVSGQAKARWMGPSENPFGVRILNMQAFAHSIVSTSRDPNIARKYGALRASTGEEYRGQLPQDSRTVACSLISPLRQRPDEGPLFKSQEMEEKWDIYFYDGYLYFARSWRGDLMFRARIQFEEEPARITEIETSWKDDEDEFVVQQVDYLIKSHVLDFTSLHPLPPSRRTDPPMELAAFSFARFGSRGIWGTFEDTLKTRITPSGT